MLARPQLVRIKRSVMVRHAYQPARAFLKAHLIDFLPLLLIIIVEDHLLP